MFEFEGHIHGKEIESKLECLAIGKYFLQLEVGADDCVHFTWNPLSGSGDFSCDAMADCITTSEAVQDALTNFIQTNDFTLEGERTFNNTVQFNDAVLFTAEVTFEGGPVNFSELEINWDQVTWNVNDSVFNIENSEINFIESNITLDANSVFTNEGETILNGPTTIENLTVTNFVLGPGSDLSGMISTDGSNCLTVGSDGGLYIACGGGAFSCDDVADCIDNNINTQTALANWFANATTGDATVQGALDTYIGNYLTNAGITPFACSDVADCIDNDANVQAALDAWFIDAITNDVNVQNAVQAFIEGADLTITGDWIFNGSVTFNGSVIGVGGGGSGVVADKIESFIAGENINSGEHTSLVGDVENQASNTTSITVAGGPYFNWTMNIGHAFTTSQDNEILSADFLLTFSKQNATPGNYSFEAKLYAATGTVGSTAVPTGPVLATSNTIAFSSGELSNAAYGLSFVFSGANIPAGDYCISIEGSGSTGAGAWNNVGLRAGVGGSHYGNSYQNGVTVASDIVFAVKLKGFAMLSSAAAVGTAKYLGQATESKLTGEDINIKTRGTITQTGASNDESIRYLSNTPGVLASSAGTIEAIAGKGIGTNQVSLRGLSDVSVGDNGIRKWPARVTTGFPIDFYSAGGGLLTANLDYSYGGSPDFQFYIQTSDDGVVYQNLLLNRSGADLLMFGGFSLPIIKSKFVRLTRTGSNGTIILNNLQFLPY